MSGLDISVAQSFSIPGGRSSAPVTLLRFKFFFQFSFDENFRYVGEIEGLKSSKKVGPIQKSVFVPD